MTATLDKGNIDYKAELLRKSIHLLSLSIAIVYYFVTKELALTLLIPFTLISLVLDLARYLFPAYRNFLYSNFGFMLREHEINSKQITLSGATYVLIAALVTVIFFPKVFVILGIAVLIFGDIFAALIGRKFGNRDHTTAIHAYNKISQELENNENLVEEINLIKDHIYHS